MLEAWGRLVLFPLRPKTSAVVGSIPRCGKANATACQPECQKKGLRGSQRAWGESSGTVPVRTSFLNWVVILMLTSRSSFYVPSMGSLSDKGAENTHPYIVCISSISLKNMLSERCHLQNQTHPIYMNEVLEHQNKLPR